MKFPKKSEVVAINKRLLFARVGFTPRAFVFLCEKIMQEPIISDRTATGWVNGTQNQKNPRYELIAKELDIYLSKRAGELLSYGQREYPVFKSNKDYHEATSDNFCHVDIYTQLLQRIAILDPTVNFAIYDPNLHKYPIKVGFDWSKE